MKRITEAQQAFLNTLRCERLSSNIQNISDVSGFYNSKSESLSLTIQNEAFNDDEMGRSAFYLVKDNKDNILLYFSLKCGVLYDYLINTDTYKKLVELYQELVELERDASLSEDDKKTVLSILEGIRSRKGVVKAEIKKLAKLRKPIEEFEAFIQDEGTDKVGQTFAGIELVQFCANEGMSQIWASYQMPQKLGVIAFWQFIVPNILEAMKYVGCEYLFLFAADQSDDENLVNYYKHLGFHEPDGVNTSMPLYDISCKMLCYEVSRLQADRNEFFTHFND